MSTILITGGTRGIGRELANQYKNDGWTVLVTGRNPDGADVNADRVLALDVASQSSIDALKAELGDMPIDLLWNNAGVYLDKGLSLSEMTFENWGETFLINSVAPMLIASAFASNVAASEHRKMAFTTSRMGSIDELGEAADNAYAYRSSKTALNMAVSIFTNRVRPQGIRTAMLHPGWVRTDMGGPTAAIDVLESATGMKAVMDGLDDATSGTFFNYDGGTFNW